MKINDIRTYDITTSDIRIAVSKALENTFIDNLRIRHPLVKLDSKIRGYLGELLILRVLSEINVEVVGTGDSEEDDTDIDITINSNHEDNIKIEVKTSLIPDSWKTLENVVKNGDIKIIKRESQCTDIMSDIHVQIYYNLLTNQRDNYLKSIEEDITDLSIDDLIELLKLEQLRQAFVAWIDKKTLVSQLNLLPRNQQIWRFSFREFWNCKISNARTFEEFTNILPNYTK